MSEGYFTLQFEKAGTFQIEYAIAPMGGSPQSGNSIELMTHLEVPASSASSFRNLQPGHSAAVCGLYGGYVKSGSALWKPTSRTAILALAPWKPTSPTAIPALA
jgi:hypothetical protein